MKRVGEKKKPNKQTKDNNREKLKCALRGKSGLEWTGIVASDVRLLLFTEEVTEPQLPSPLPLQTLFVNRLAFVSGEVEDGGVSPTLWYSTPLPDDIDPEVDLVRLFSCSHCDVIL